MDQINSTIDFIYNIALIFRNKLKLSPLNQINLLASYFSMVIFKTKRYKSYSFNYINFNYFLGLFSHRFIRNDYYFYSQSPCPTIIDCGANIGDSVLYFKDLYPNSKIIAIEPDKLTFNVLRSNLITNNIKNTSILNKAVSNKQGVLTFYMNNSDPTTGTMSLMAERGNKDTIKVKSIKLSKLINEKVDLLKLDIEGAEIIVLKELDESNKFKYIQEMIIEYHHNMIDCKDKMSEFLNILEKNGYRYQLSTSLKPPFIKNLFQDILVYAYKIN